MEDLHDFFKKIELIFSKMKPCIKLYNYNNVSTNRNEYSSN